MNGDDAFYKALLDDIGDGVYFVDRERKITYWNKMAEEITGYSAEDVVGRHCHDDILGHVDQKGINLCREGCPLTESIGNGNRCEADVFLRHRNGHRVPVRVKVSPIRDPSGEIVGAVELFSDNSATVATRRRIEELERLAMLDTLTQLPNRRYLDASLEAQLSESRRTGTSFGVGMIDVDLFKCVNDEHGHQIGDEVLKVVAATLSSNMRPLDTVGRWGGEEFLALIRDDSYDEVRSVAERLRALVGASAYRSHEVTVCVTVSIGVTMACSGQTVADIVRAADNAMYASKASGRNRVSSAGRGQK